MKVDRALLSVYNKNGIVKFARGLHNLGIEILSTGGTARLLSENNIPVTEVSDVTGYREMLDGRVKTLHPKVHAGILADRSNPEHMRQLKSQEINTIDLVVVNLYPFEGVVSKKRVSLKEALENIDIGGPTLVRAAAKNYEHVGVVVKPERYAEVLRELEKHGRLLSNKMRSMLALEAFQHTAEYDLLISQYFSRKFGFDSFRFPDKLGLSFNKVRTLRYGENPHQHAAFYKELGISEACISNGIQHHGKALSFNNILDLNDALELVKEFREPAAAVIKHTNPCGVALGKTLAEAYERARGSDPLSAFGSVVGFNRIVDSETASEIVKTFVEAVVATGYRKKALKILKQKKNLRVIEAGKISRPKPSVDMKRVVGGLLMQDRDIKQVRERNLSVVSKRKPSKKEVEDLLFAWKVVRHVKSNAIVFSRDGRTAGIGAGQMSRVDAVKIAAMKSNGGSKGAVMASDAFFPFRDAIDEAAKAGITAVIQPGGSIRDQEVIDTVDEHDMAMVFTGVRCFRH